MTGINLQQTILRNLLTNEEYTRKVLPFIAPDYFEGAYKKIFLVKLLSSYTSTTNFQPKNHLRLK